MTRGVGECPKREALVAGRELALDRAWTVSGSTGKHSQQKAAYLYIGAGVLPPASGLACMLSAAYG